MNIVLKPLGAVTIVAAIGILAFIAYRSYTSRSQSPLGASSQKSEILQGDTNSLIVYKDSLENGWKERGWAKVIDYADKTSPRGGSGTDIRVEAEPYEAIKIYNPQADVSKYKYLTAYVNGGETGGQTINLATVAGGKNQGVVSLAPLPAKRWVRVAVPLADLRVQDRKDFTAFWFQNQSNTKTTFFVDDIQLTTANIPSGAEEILEFSKAEPKIP